MAKKKQSPKPRLISNKYTDQMIDFLGELRESGLKWPEIADKFNKKFRPKKKKSPETLRICYINNKDYKYSPKYESPKVLILDIETAPILGYVWSLWNNNLGLNQMHTDWYVLSWAAKWLGDSSDKVMYKDQRDAIDIEDDSELLSDIWHLIDEADIILTQNGVSFDTKKLNARFIQHGFEPPSSYKQIDTKIIAKKNFKFTSNKLEYMTDKLCTEYKKLKHAKFGGFELWKACLEGNLEAWDEMKEYNIYDILSLEELYFKMAPWDSTINFNLYHDDLDFTCKCGSTEFRKSGFHYTAAGKYQKYKCKSCGHETRDTENLLSKEKRKSMRRELR